MEPEGKQIKCGLCNYREATVYDGVDYLCETCYYVMLEDELYDENNLSGHRSERTSTNEDMGSGS